MGKMKIFKDKMVSICSNKKTSKDLVGMVGAKIAFAIDATGLLVTERMNAGLEVEVLGASIFKVKLSEAVSEVLSMQGTVFVPQASPYSTANLLTVDFVAYNIIDPANSYIIARIVNKATGAVALPGATAFVGIDISYFCTPGTL